MQVRDRRLVLVGLGLVLALLAWLKLPPTEMETLSGIPLRGWEVGTFAGLPMLVCAGVVLGGRRWFGRRAAGTCGGSGPREA